MDQPNEGHKVGSTQTLAADTYAPLYIDANIPNGAFLNWSVLNSAGEVLPGMQGTNELIVPLNLLDHDLVDQFRLHLEFKGSESGIPEVHSITGDGAYRETFVTDPTTRGWTLSDAAYVTGIGVVGSQANSTLTSPWMLAHAPLYDVGLDGSVASGQVQVRYHPDEAWMNVSLPFTPTPDQNTVGMQARVVSVLPADGNMSNFTAWNVEALGNGHVWRPAPCTPHPRFQLGRALRMGR